MGKNKKQLEPFDMMVRRVTKLAKFINKTYDDVKCTGFKFHDIDDLYEPYAIPSVHLKMGTYIMIISISSLTNESMITTYESNYSNEQVKELCEIMDKLNDIYEEYVADSSCRCHKECYDIKEGF